MFAIKTIGLKYGKGKTKSSRSTDLSVEIHPEVVKEEAFLLVDFYRRQLICYNFHQKKKKKERVIFQNLR